MSGTFGVDFEGLTKIFNGAATIIESKRKLAISSSAADISRCGKSFELWHGDIFTVTVNARVISKTDEKTAYISLKENGTTQRNTMWLNNSDWQQITLCHSQSLAAPTGNELYVEMGVADGKAGNVEFADPRIDIKSGFGSLRTLAAGVISGSTGSMTVSNAFVNLGINSIAYDAGTSTLSIFVPSTSGAAGTNPIVNITMANPVGTDTWLLRPNFISYSAATGEVKIQFRRSDTGALVDIGGWGTFSFIFTALIN